MINKTSKIQRTMLVGCFVAASTLTAAQGAFSGAIYTSKSDGTLVNQNIYASKPEVYLNGGPQNTSSQGLPTGTYYFQVTSPSGILLSTDAAISRQVAVNAGGYIAGGTGPSPHANGGTNPTTGAIPVQLIPYNDTPNSGGEYKVWLIRQSGALVDPGGIIIDFSGADSKTDNFKVHDGDGSGSGTTKLEGSKFYDFDADGVWDDNANEMGVEGVRINVYYDDPNDNPDEGWILIDGDGVGYTTMTDHNGDWEVFYVPNGVQIKVCEVLPETGTTSEWVQTYPNMNQDGERCWLGPTPNEGGLIDNLDFGNVCAFEVNCFRTQGFWGNKNGKKIIEAKEGTLAPFEHWFTKWVDPLCLFYEDGSPLVFTGVFEDDWKTWKAFLRGSNARNMSYMLSVQYAVLKHNYGLHAFCSQEEMDSLRFLLTDVEGLAECWTQYRYWENHEFDADAYFGEISAFGTHLLCSDGGNIVISGDPRRPAFECAKDLADAVNNNAMRALHDEPCDVVYPAEDPLS